MLIIYYKWVMIHRELLTQDDANPRHPVCGPEPSMEPLNLQKGSHLQGTLHGKNAWDHCLYGASIFAIYCDTASPVCFRLLEHRA